MATAVARAYTATSGARIAGGIWAGGRLQGSAQLDGAVAAGSAAMLVSNLTGFIALDDMAPGGNMAGFVMPTWLSGAAVGQWVDIPGTANPPAGLKMGAFSDMTLRPNDSTILAVASGGHNDGSSNAAASISIEADSPSWTTRFGGSSSVQADVLYYADGRPTSRHTYHHTHYIAGLNAVLLAGCRFGYGGGTPTGFGMDLFSLTTNDYLARYTYPDGVNYGVVQDGDGNIWTSTDWKFNVATQTWANGFGVTGLRYPAAFDSARNKIFGLQFGDGEGFNLSSGVLAAERDVSTGSVRTITFNSSAALTQFAADQPQYAGMAFSPIDGKFYFLHPGRMGTFYVVTPNAGAVWDMATWSPTGTALANNTATLCKRLLYVPRLSGFVVQLAQTSNMKFVRLA